MNLPQLLIIGAMKSGTTTLYDDLRRHPSVFFPIDKEPDFFSKPDSASDAAVAEYAKLFKGAKPDQIGTEASTSYTKRPTYEGVAERARQVLGEGLRAIYILRDPVKRAISHHKHDQLFGLMGADIDQAVKDHPELIDYSRYAYQVEPWIQALGRDNVLLLRFEDYVSDRQAGLDGVCDWLGIERFVLEDPTRQMNASNGKPILTGPWTSIAHSGLYRKLVRPFLPIGVKSWVQNTLLQRADATHLDPPSRETLGRLVSALQGDAERIGALMGSPGPAWDLNKHLEQEPAPAPVPQKAKA